MSLDSAWGPDRSAKPTDIHPNPSQELTDDFIGF